MMLNSLLNKVHLEKLLSAVVFLFILFNCFSCKESHNSPQESTYIKNDSIKFYLEQYALKDLSKEEKIENITKALELARNSDNDTLKRAAFIEIAAAYSKLKEFDSFKEISLELGVNSRRLKDSTGLAASFYNLGNYYYAMDKLDSAYNNYFRAERVYAKLDKKKEAGNAMLSMAIIQKNVKDYVGSEASSVKAIQYFLPIEDFRYLASANSNLGLVETEQYRFDIAIDYHKKALDYRIQLKNKALEASSYNNIGLVYIKKEQYSEAIKNYNMGLSYDSLIYKRPKTYVRLLDNRAYAKFLAKDMGELPRLFQETLELRDSLNDNFGIVTSNLHLAEYYLAEDSFALANTYAKRALEKSRPLKYNRGMLESLQLLSKTSDDREALGYSKAYIKINDSLQKQERAFQDQFARIRFETDTIETEKNKVTQQKENLIIALMFLVSVFLLVYTLIQRKLNRKELRFRQSQQEANEEIYSLMQTQQLKLEEGKQLEKKRISEELHDGVLGKLFGTRLSLDGLNQKNDVEAIQSRSKYIDELKNIEQEIRQISHELNSSMFSSKDVYIDVVESLISNKCEISGLKYQFEYDDSINWEVIPDNKKVHFYRIIQESLQNIRKHAKASLVKIKFTKEANSVELIIEDDGIGMNVKKVKGGIGVKNIRSRVQQMGGNLNIESNNGKGTSILVKINF